MSAPVIPVPTLDQLGEQYRLSKLIVKAAEKHSPTLTPNIRRATLAAVAAILCPENEPQTGADQPRWPTD